MHNRKYTDEHIAFLAGNIKGCHFADLAAMFNQHFGFNLSRGAIASLAAKHGLHNGIDSGLKGSYEPTQFKKGNRPWNYRPVGSERIIAAGYTIVKVADPSKWRFKHVLLWEAAFGPVPNGYILAFADGNRLNITLDNLIPVTRRQLIRLNQNHLIQSDPELTKSGVIVADIIAECAARKKDAHWNV